MSRTRMMWAGAVVAVVAVASGVVHGLGTGQSFQSMASGYQQELYGATQLPADADGFATVLGGVAFAPNGDVWTAECLFSGTTLHRFDKATLLPLTNGTSTLHAESAVVPTQGGCGLTNAPDGYLYSNSMFGVVRLDANTGLPAPWPDAAGNPRGPAGNALGITADPKTGHIVYAGADCHVSLVPGATTCTIYDLNPADGTVSAFAPLNHGDLPFADGLYFDPGGSHLFVANRGDVSTGPSLMVLRRPEDSVPNTAFPQIAQSVPTANDPDGVAFHATSPKFVLTNDEDTGTITRFDFASDDYTTVPTASTFASGGFRGDLLNVGPDGCIYATQGRNLLATDFGTRYDSLLETTEDGVVRICSAEGGGFTPGPGVTETVASVQGGISGVTYLDANNNGVYDAGEQVLSGVTVTLTGGPGGMQVTSPTGYTFASLPGGSYAVSAPASAAGLHLSTTSPLTVALAAGQTLAHVDFGYRPGSINGTVFRDDNGNGVRDAGEPAIPGVTVTLAGASSGTTTTSASGSYTFSNLTAGAYSVSVPGTTAGLLLSTTSPLSVTLAAGENRFGIDFGYKPGSISGMAFMDYNNNGIHDANEPGIPGVTITITGAASGTQATATGGVYAFAGLSGGSYSVSAPATAAGLQRSTASPLTVVLGAGENRAHVDFGYRETTVPTCPYVILSGTPTRVVFTIQDAGGGLASLQLTQLTNFSVLITPPGGAPITTLQTVTYNPPVTSAVTLTASRITASKSASITFSARDAFGNLVSCDPTTVTVRSVGRVGRGHGMRATLRERGSNDLTVVDNVPDTEHYVTITNNTPGLRRIDILVNRTWFHVTDLENGQQITLDIASGMEPGANNRIVIAGRGRPGGTAEVTIADIPG